MRRRLVACCTGAGTVGHQRLGKIPTTRKWSAVVDQVLGASGGLAEHAPQIAAYTLDAAAVALGKGAHDTGLRHTFYLLTQIVLASRQPNWQAKLSEAGIPIGQNASIFDLVAGLQLAIDRHIESHGKPTDISEMAQQAVGEALTMLAGGSISSLFGEEQPHLQSALRSLSTKDGFAHLGQVFFGRFLTRFLNFYLSRITAREVGTDCLPSISDVSAFDGALRTHCEQSAWIVRDFCGSWYSKTTYLEGIDDRNSSRFMAVALRKLSRELARQRAET